MAVAPKAPQYEEMRTGLFSGIVASGGATVGWLLWLSLQAFAKDWKILLAPLLGLLIGHTSDWLEHYYKVSRYEAKHGNWTGEDHAEGHDSPEAMAVEAQAAKKKTHNLRIWTLSLTFLALACEHIVGHLVQEFMLPFLASIATLFPIGFLFGLALNKNEKPKNPFETFFQGAFVGAIGALVASIIQFLLYGAVSWGAIFGWWILFGIGLNLCSPDKVVMKPSNAITGFALVVAFVLICSLPNISGFLEGLPGPLGVPGKALAMSVNGALSAPDLPSQYWAEAEVRAAAAEARVTEKEPKSEWGSKLAKMLGYDEDGGSSSSSDTDYSVDENGIFKSHISEQMDKLAQAGRYDFSRVVDSPLYKAQQDRNQTLGRELSKGFSSGLVRSLIVLFLFALGLGFAPGVEKYLRPIDYPSSRTYAHDKKLLWGMLSLIVLACILVRIAPHL